MVEFTPEEMAGYRAALANVAPVPKFSGRREPLGKRANTVSVEEHDKGHKDSLRARSRRMDAQECQCREVPGKPGQRANITLEKDQPRHVRERYSRLRRFQLQDTAA